MLGWSAWGQRLRCSCRLWLYRYSVPQQLHRFLGSLLLTLFPDVGISFIGAAWAPGASDFFLHPTFRSFSSRLAMWYLMMYFHPALAERSVTVRGPFCSLLASLYSQTSWPSVGSRGCPCRYHGQQSADLCESSRKSSSAQLRRQCWFKLRVSDTGQFLSDTFKYSTIWEKKKILG